MTPKKVLAFAKEQGAKMVDFKFLDFIGTWQHFTNPSTNWVRRISKTATDLTARASAGGNRSTPVTC